MGLAAAAAAIGSAIDFFAGAGIAAELATGLGLATLGEGGVLTATTAGLIAEGAGVGALGGGLIGGITTGKPLTGALEGALVGGAIPAGGALLGGALGGGALAAGVGDVLAGAGAGAVGGAIAGQNPLTGAISGGLAGGVAGLAGVGAGTSAAATSAPGSAAGAASDLSQADPLQGLVSPGPGAITTGSSGLAGAAAPGSYTGVDPLQGLVSSGPGAVTTGAAGASDVLGVGGAAASAVNPTSDAASTAGGAASKTNWSNFTKDPLGTLGSAVQNNPSTVLGGLGLGYNALKGQQVPKGMNALTNEANALLSEANRLSSSALNNALPPGAQAQLNQAANSMKAQISSQYARMGLAGSSMEAQAMAAADEAISGQGYQMMQQLLQQGLSAAQAADVVLTQVMSARTSQSNALTGAIGNFAGALAGGRG